MAASWTRVSGDHLSCASQRHTEDVPATWYMLAGDVGSYYCDGCRNKIVKCTIGPRSTPKVHDLKCAAGYFEAVEMGTKTAELRLNDRDFAPHDIIRLHELEYGALTGKTLERRITHIVWDSNGPWLAPGYCMLSLGKIEER